MNPFWPPNPTTCGPYTQQPTPCIGNDERKRRFRSELQTTLYTAEMRSKIERLFARDFEFDSTQVVHWLFPGTIFDQEGWDILMEELEDRRKYFQNVMFGPEAIRKDVRIEHFLLEESLMSHQVFDIAANYEMTHPGARKLKHLDNRQRRRILEDTFTIEIALRILKPVEQSVDVPQLLADSSWWLMYRDTFVAAAEAVLQNHHGFSKDGTPLVFWPRVYHEVRRVPNKRYPNRPRVEDIPRSSGQEPSIIAQQFERPSGIWPDQEGH